MSKIGEPTTKHRLRLPDSLYALNDEGPVVSAFQAMFARLLVGGAVVPCLGSIKGRKLEHDCSFDFRTLQYLMTAIGDSKRDRMARQSRGSDLGISLKLFGIASTVANENSVSWYIFYSSWNLIT